MVLEQAKMLGSLIVRDPSTNVDQIALIMAIVRNLDKMIAKEAQ